MRWDTTGFKHARENMNYDVSCVQRLHKHTQTHFFRQYTWQDVSITQSEKRAIPEDLSHVDHAFRLTGGGLVFHCPGDIVFSSAAPIKNTPLPSRLKERCYWMAKAINTALNNKGIFTELAGDIPVGEQDINFCTTYHNPYELILQGQKICGIALKKTHDFIVFQGIIHIQATKTWFGALSADYEPYFTKGCDQIQLPSNTDIMKEIQVQLTKALG